MKFSLTTFAQSILRHPLLKGSVIMLAGSMVANVAAYAYHVVIGRLLGPVIYGEFSALMSLFYLINIGSGVVQTVLTKFFSQLRAGKRLGEVPSLFYTSVRWLALVTGIGLLFSLMLSGVAADFLHVSTFSVLLLYVIFVTYVFSIVHISLLQAFQRFVATTVLTNTGSILRIIFGVIGAPFGLSGILVANVASNALTYVLYFIPVSPILRVKRTALTITHSDAFGYSIPAMFATFGTVALYSQDVLLVKHYFSAHEAGIYASLAVLGKVIYYASAALGYVMFPMVAEAHELKKSHHRLVRMSLFAVCGLSLAFTLLYFLFPSEIVRLMYGSAFDGAIPYMGLFGIFITLFTAVNLLITAFLAAGNTSVWRIMIAAACMQFAGLSMFHTSISQVIWVNIVVTGLSAVSLLVYYFYERE